MASKFLTELSNDYEKLFETELRYDVIIYAGEGQNAKEIMLTQIFYTDIRSQYFVLHFLMNGLKKMMENLFLEN
jgi:hypothetical protein